MTSFGLLANIVMAVIVGLMGLYLPGRLIVRLSRCQAARLEQLIISLLAGTGVLTISYWLLIAVNLPFLLRAVIIFLAGLEIWYSFRHNKIQQYKIPDPDAEPMRPWRQDWPLGLIIVITVSLQGRFIFGSAWPGESEMTFLAWHGVDAPGHVFNLQQFTRAGVIEMPGFAGQALKVYHVFFDLFLGALRRLLPFDHWHLYFRIAPFFYSLMLTAGTYLVTLTWKQKQAIATTAALMMVIMSNFGYLMPLIFPEKQYFLWDALFWVQPPLTHLINPPNSSSYLFLLGGSWALLKWHQTRMKGYLFFIGLFWGSIIGFKIYGGLLVLVSLLGLALIDYVVNRRYHFAQAWLAILPLQLLVLIPKWQSSSQLIHFVPGYNLATMLVSPDRLNLMSSAAFKSLFINSPWQTALVIAGAMVLFVIGNLGPRVIALPAMIMALIRPKQNDPFLLWATILSIAALIGATFFIQTGFKWNTIQFFYYAVVVTTIIAAAQIWDWLKKMQPSLKIVLLILYLIIGLPGTYQALKVINWHNVVSAEQVKACQWLRAATAKERVTILRPLPDQLLSDEGFGVWQSLLRRGRLTSIKAMRQEAQDRSGATKEEKITVKRHLVENDLMQHDTAIVAALVGQNTYLEHMIHADNMNYPVLERAVKVRHFYTKANVIEAREFLEQENINYVMINNKQPLPFKVSGVPLKVVYTNSKLTIYKYIKQGGW